MISKKRIRNWERDQRLIQEVLKITSLKQAKVLANPMRLKIFNTLTDLKPRTCMQLSEMLEVPRNKVHYHLKELLQADLINLSHKQEKNGIMEKYYLPVAKKIYFDLDDSMKREETLPKDTSHQTIIKNLFNEHRDAFMKSKFSTTNSTLNTKLAFKRLNLTADQKVQLFQELEHLYNKWSMIEEGQHTESVTFLLAVYKNMD